MTTLLAMYTSDGCVGRCDARCYNAVHPDCTCICGGRNHGAGRAQALDNTRALAQRWITSYAHEHGLKHFSSEIHPECQQLTLWSDT